MTSFTVSLPSNASLDLYPENTLSHFKVQLAKRLNLQRYTYEVALAQIDYVNNVCTFNKKLNDHCIICTFKKEVKKNRTASY